jgi:hypothetical protein
MITWEQPKSVLLVPASWLLSAPLKKVLKSLSSTGIRINKLIVKEGDGAMIAPVKWDSKKWNTLIWMYDLVKLISMFWLMILNILPLEAKISLSVSLISFLSLLLDNLFVITFSWFQRNGSQEARVTLRRGLSIRRFMEFHRQRSLDRQLGGIFVQLGPHSIGGGLKRMEV